MSFLRRARNRLRGYQQGGYANPPATEYEPAGIIHYGEHHIMLGINHYSAYNQPDGTTEVWANGEHIGNYPKDESLWKIIDHAKDQK